MVIKATNQEPVMELPSSMLGFEDVVVKLLSKKIVGLSAEIHPSIREVSSQVPENFDTGCRLVDTRQCFE